MSNNNLNLWNTVSQTDTAFTKNVNQRGGYTSITPMYQAKCATEAFGMYGKGWGLESSELDYTIFEKSGMVINKAVFFYVVDGEKTSFPISNAILAVTGSRADPDWAKKLETNTVSKALSKLGFNADIFMGMFDDPNYVEFIKFEESINNAEDKSKEIIKKTNELKQWCKKEIEAHGVCKSKNTLDLVIVKQRQTLSNKCQLLNLDYIAWEKPFTTSYDNQIKTINGAK